MSITRRAFMDRLLKAAGVLALAGLFRPRAAAAAAPSGEWFNAGKAGAFALDTPVLAKESVRVSDGKLLKLYPVHVIRRQAGVRVFSSRCTHLGGPLEWKADEKHYVCPWHKAQFDAQGAVLAGPAKKALPEYEAKLEGGSVLFRSPA